MLRKRSLHVNKFGLQRLCVLLFYLHDNNCELTTEN